MILDSRQFESFSGRKEPSTAKQLNNGRALFSPSVGCQAYRSRRPVSLPAQVINLHPKLQLPALNVPNSNKMGGQNETRAQASKSQKWLSPVACVCVVLTGCWGLLIGLVLRETFAGKTIAGRHLQLRRSRLTCGRRISQPALTPHAQQRPAPGRRIMFVRAHYGI